jgi:hypothetical protein
MGCTGEGSPNEQQFLEGIWRSSLDPVLMEILFRFRFRVYTATRAIILTWQAGAAYPDDTGIFRKGRSGLSFPVPVVVFVFGK